MSDDPTSTPSDADISTLPQWARDAISRANNEAASRRVEIRQLTDKTTELMNELTASKDVKTAAEKATNDKGLELQKVLIALDAGVPGERVRSIAARLQGSTEDELKADAAALVADFGINAGPAPVRATDPSQGRGNDTAPVPNTPQAELAQLLGNLDIFRR